MKLNRNKFKRFYSLFFFAEMVVYYFSVPCFFFHLTVNLGNHSIPVHKEFQHSFSMATQEFRWMGVLTFTWVNKIILWGPNKTYLGLLSSCTGRVVSLDPLPQCWFSPETPLQPIPCNLSQHPQSPALVQALAPSVCSRLHNSLHFPTWPIPTCSPCSRWLAVQKKPCMAPQDSVKAFGTCQRPPYCQAKPTLPPHAFHLSSDMMTWTHVFYASECLSMLVLFSDLSNYVSLSILQGFLWLLFTGGSYLFCRDSF